MAQFVGLGCLNEYWGKLSEANTNPLDELAPVAVIHKRRVEPHHFRLSDKGVLAKEVFAIASENYSN